MEITLATKEHIPEIMDIINDSKYRLKKAGVNQWQDGYPNEAVFSLDCEKNECYICVENQKICGVFVLSFLPEPSYTNIYEGSWGGEFYGVLHRVAVHNDYLGTGLASNIIEYAKSKCLQLCEQKEEMWLRVDTHEDNKAMQRLLEKNQFTYCGIIYLEDGSKRLAYNYKV